MKLTAYIIVVIISLLSGIFITLAVQNKLYFEAALEFVAYLFVVFTFWHSKPKEKDCYWYVNHEDKVIANSPDPNYNQYVYGSKSDIQKMIKDKDSNIFEYYILTR